MACSARWAAGWKVMYQVFNRAGDSFAHRFITQMFLTGSTTFCIEIHETLHIYISISLSLYLSISLSLCLSVSLSLCQMPLCTSPRTDVDMKWFYYLCIYIIYIYRGRYNVGVSFRPRAIFWPDSLHRSWLVSNMFKFYSSFFSLFSYSCFYMIFFVCFVSCMCVVFV